MTDLNWLDILSLSVLATSAVAGLFKGLAKELISLGSVILGFLLALLFYPQTALLFQAAGVSELVASPLGFVAIFLVAIISGAFLVRLIRSALQILRLRWADRLLGGVFGVARGWLLNAVIFLSLAALPISSEVLAGSKTAEFFLTSARLLLTFSSSDLKERFKTGFDRVYQVWIEETLEDGVARE